jgi:hypothetical protein
MSNESDLDVRPRRTAWAIALAAMLLGIAMWPILGGFRAANDDVKWVRSADHALGLWGALGNAWREEASFRPLEVAVAHYCDQVTLACLPAIVVQAAGLVALVLVARRAARACMPGHRSAWAVVVTYLAVSPATTCSLWQMDSCSQTWTAVLGTWCALRTWEAIASAKAGRIDARGIALLSAAFVAGCSVKEIFYGWSAGIGGAVLAATVIAVARPRTRAAAGRIALLAVPTILVPLLHLAARFLLGSLGDRISGAEGSRYTAELGLNVIVNAAMSAAGIFGSGPFHLATDEHAPLPLRIAPYLSIAAALFLMLGAAGLSALGRRKPAGVDLGATCFIAVSCALSVSATIPMGSVSELHGFGANIGAALLVSAAACVLWSNEAPDERMLSRWIALTCAGTFVGVGLYGLASRALHFRAVWISTDSVNRRIIDFQDRLRPQEGQQREFAGVVRFTGDCLLTRTYSQYVIPPVQAINLQETGPWLARRHPDRPIGFSIGRGAGVGDERELVLDCAEDIDHGHW